MNGSKVRFCITLFIVMAIFSTLSCVKSSTSSGSGPGPGGGNTVSMRDNLFSPGTITVTLSGGSVTVKWVNNGNAAHTATSDTPGQFDTGTISPGQTDSIIFLSAGTYPYHCELHSGMNGNVVVQ